MTADHNEIVAVQSHHARRLDDLIHRVKSHGLHGLREVQIRLEVFLGKYRQSAPPEKRCGRFRPTR